MMARFDVVIVTYGNRGSIAACVGAAWKLPGVADVVVVDHGGDESGDVARAGGARVLVDHTNPGFGAGQNRGVQATSAPFVLLLNPDAEPDPVGVTAGVRLLQAEASVGAVQGVIVNRATSRPERSHGCELGPIHLVGRALGARRLLGSASARRMASAVRILADHVDRVPAAPVGVDSMAATALLVRRAAFVSIGGFDERYFLYGEDLDLCRRLRAAGWRLVAVPERFAVHESGGSSEDPVSRELSWWRGTMRFAAQWWSGAAWCGALGAASLQALRISVRAPRRARLAWRSLLVQSLRDRRLGRRGSFGAAQSSTAGSGAAVR